MTDVTSLICSFVPDSVKQIPFDFVKRQFIYFFRHESRVNDLKEQIGRLKDAKGRVETGVEAATRNGEEVHKDVSEWLGRAREVSRDEKAEELERARERARARFFLGLCPNLWSRRQLCKKAIAEAVDVAVLLKDYPNAPMFKGEVAHRPALTEVMLDEDIMTFESRDKTFEGIMKALEDPSVSRVGVYGMGGVGKTTLIKQVQQKARKKKIFEEIALTTVTSEPDTKRIQEEIADALGLKFEAKTVAERARELSHRLNNDQKILIVLDDIWEELSLPDIGISFKDCQIVDGNKMPRKGRRKILMTSRNEDVLRVMKSTSASNFEVALLPFPEAESLFTIIVEVPRGDNYKSIATEVVEKCAGSPIAIAAVAKVLLANPSMDVWQDVRNKLKRSMANNSVVKHVHETLKLSYEMLKEEEAKPLFLLLGMFDQGASISADVLLRYGVGLELFDGVGTYHEARSRVNALLHKLRASSLLLKGDYNDTVKLHDLVRDVAANIANSDPYNMFRIEGKSDFKRLSKNGKLSHATGLFILPGSELPEVLECPKLQFLHIRHKEKSFIYDRLFEQTKELKVLHLTSMKELKSLPASLLSLTSLQSLCLDDCYGIRDISNIGKLQHLLVLRIRGSDIEELPEDLKQLRELQLLDLSNCNKLKVIPENLFSSLTKLEELYMGNSFKRWGVVGNASVSELLNLSSLTVLHIHIPQAEMIPEGMPFEKLTAYKIVIGDHTYWPWDCNYEKSGKLMICNQIPNAKKLLARTEELRLLGLKGVRNVLYELDSHGFLHLKDLRVDFSSLQYLVNFEGNRFSNAKAFPDLESLSIMDSDDLEMVCHGQPKAEALMRLRSIKISFCDALTRLYPLSMAKYLLQLEEIEVNYCENLITIFDMGIVDSNEASETTGGIELSKLRSLTFRYLPKFVGFCTQDQQIQPLFNERILLPHTLDTMPSRMSDGLVNLTSLTIGKCGHLKYLFSFSVVRTLGQLQRLKVSDCKSMEMIVLGEETNAGNEFGAKLSFPQLKFLELQHMENLRGFCSKNYDVDFPSLERLDVSDCYLLEPFFSTNDTNLQPYNDDKRLLPHTPDTIRSRMSYGLKCLTSLTIHRCGHLKYLFPFSIARTLEQLQRMEVSHCSSMEVIVLGEETNPGNEFGAKLSFPQLKFLMLQHMENLRGFCSKNSDVDFPSLETVELSECHQLEVFFSTHDSTLQSHFMDKRLLPHTPDTIPSRISYGLKCLTSLTIHRCGHLKYLFSFSIARTLEKLQRMEVSHCSSMEMIVLGEETNPGNEFGAKLSFPQLKFLMLQHMENLRGFCSKNSDVDFPSLETVKLSECHQLEVFFSTHDSTLQPHFMDKRLLPHTPDTIPSRMSYGLRCLTWLSIHQCGHLKYLFSFSIARTLEQLQGMEVSHCSSMEMIVLGEETNPGNEFGAKLSFPQLKFLMLQHMENLRGFCSKNSDVDFPSLKTVELSECHQLEVFFPTHDITLQPHFMDKRLLPHTADTIPSRMSYGVKSLTSLTIHQCGHLKYLFSFSIARTLEQLQRMEVIHCSSMEMIVLGDETSLDSDFGAKLSLPRLNLLKLECMENLRGFCSKNYDIDFPSLETVELSKCHQLEVFFSTHDISLQPHFNDKAYFTQILDRNLEDITQFQCLKHLDFSSFDNLKYLFNHSMAFNLVLLEFLHVESCKMMKEIVTEEITAPNQNETVIFPCLKTLYVRDCPNLINFCAGKQALKFPSLQQLLIRRCPNVLSFYSTSTEGEVGPSNCTSPSFFSDKVALPSLLSLEMVGCDSVVTIFSSNIVDRFLGIWELKIINCAALEMVYEMQGLSAKEHSANGVAQLRDLNIIDLPKLRCIWSEDPQGVAFQNLSEVFAWGCENLRYLFPPSVAQGLSQLNRLMISYCGVEEVVAVDKDEQKVMRFAFPQLRKFILLVLPNLKFFYARQHTIEWPMLEFAQSDNIEGLSKVLPNTPVQPIERDTGYRGLFWM